MATVAKNRITRSVAPKSVFESAKNAIDSTVSFNQGDLIALNTTSHLLKAITATADAAFFCGIAKVSIVNGIVVSPIQGTAVDAAQAITDIPGPEYGSVCKLILKTGDAFHLGDKVYLVAANAQTVTSVDPGDHNHIGIFQGATVASASAGQEGEVLVGARPGTTDLQF